MNHNNLSFVKKHCNDLSKLSLSMIDNYKGEIAYDDYWVVKLIDWNSRALLMQANSAIRYSKIGRDDKVEMLINIMNLFCDDILTILNAYQYKAVNNKIFEIRKELNSILK